MSVEKLITEHMDVWTGAVTQNASGGRGGSGKRELTGIKKLRELILELAVRGKLASQDSADEPAVKYLDTLSPGKPAVGLDTCPIQAADMPSGWAAAPLTRLGSFSGGKTPSKAKPAYWGGEIPWVSPKDMSREEITSAQDHVTRVAVDDGLALHPAGSILIVVRSGILRRKLPVAVTNIACTVNQDLKVLRLHDGAYGPYLRLMMKGFESFILRELTKTGVTVESVKFREFAAQPFPIPPLAEQHRIVQKVDELMALCDQLEQQTGDQIDAHERLVDTLLETLTRAENATELAENWARVAQHFDTLFTTERSIDRLKQTILQLAVMGRLVQAAPGDTDAAASLEDSLPKVGVDPKYATPIDDEGSPFTIPTRWTWARFGSLGTIYGGATPSKANERYWGGSIPWVTPKDMKVDDLAATTDNITDCALSETSLRLVPDGSLLMVVRGMILAHSFPTALAQGEVCLNQDMKALVGAPLDPQYLLLVTRAMRANFVGLVDRSSHGTCKLVSEKLWNQPIPIPPPEEQRRIVAEVRSLWERCEQLIDAVIKSRRVCCLLAASVTEKAEH